MSGPLVQRWRVAYRRLGAATSLAHRDASAAWEAAITGSGLPIAMSDSQTPRPRLMFGPPPPSGTVADEELLDLFLLQRVTVAGVRAALAAARPPDHELIDVHDVWIRAPSLAASVLAADYLVGLEASVDEPTVSAAIDALLAADRIERTRERADRVSTYDLRPLVEKLGLVRHEVGARLEMRLVIDQQSGTGKPNEVMAVMREMTGLALEPVGPIVRSRLRLSPA